MEIWIVQKTANESILSNKIKVAQKMRSLSEFVLDPTTLSGIPPKFLADQFFFFNSVVPKTEFNGVVVSHKTFGKLNLLLSFPSSEPGGMVVERKSFPPHGSPPFRARRGPSDRKGPSCPKRP